MSRTKQVKKAVKRLKKASPTAIILAIVIIILAVCGYYVYNKFFKKPDPVIEAKGEISFHFMMLGNDASGDCTYIKAGENDILIDAGSDYDSIDHIMDYVDDYMTDDKFEFVIATHAHLDHIACFAGKKGENSLFDEYEVDTIIDFPLTNATSAVYNRYLEERDAEVENGAVHYTALECYNNQNGAKRVYELTDDGNVKMEILYNPYYEQKTSNENDYSVCVQFSHGSERLFLFTGDLEEDGEELLVQNNDLKEVSLFKAGHHGSYTASHDVLLSVIKPKICVISGAANNKDMGDGYGFPNQLFINRIARYDTSVYMTTAATASGYTAINGNVVVSSDAEKGVTVDCSGEKSVLKDTAWFKANRTWN